MLTNPSREESAALWMRKFRYQTFFGGRKKLLYYQRNQTQASASWCSHLAVRSVDRWILTCGICSVTAPERGVLRWLSLVMSVWFLSRQRAPACLCPRSYTSNSQIASKVSGNRDFCNTFPAVVTWKPTSDVLHERQIPFVSAAQSSILPAYSQHWHPSNNHLSLGWASTVRAGTHGGGSAVWGGINIWW